MGSNQTEPKPTVPQKVWEWLQILEPLNRNVTIRQKIEAHVELKMFIEMLVGQQE